MWVAFNMVKPAEIKQVFTHNWFHVALMTYTAVMVIVTDFLTGVLSAMVIYGVLYKFLDRPAAELVESDDDAVTGVPAPAVQPLSEVR